MAWISNQRDALGQALADTGATLSGGLSLRDPVALHVRLGDLSRSNSLLALEANLKTLEQYSRLIHVGRRSTRALAFTTLAADILSGYIMLDRRTRLWGRLTQSQDWEWQHERSATRVRDAAATLRGTLIKACQFASTRPDILPPAYTRSFATLQDHVPAYSWHAIRRAIRRELRRQPNEVFARIERHPIASASIAQVHRAWLSDGRRVALKVQYPGIAGIMTTDLALLQHIVREVARFVPAIQLQPILDHLQQTLPLELDFRREADAMTALRAALQRRSDVVIPEVIPELSTRRLLVTEFVDGIKITDTEALERAGINSAAVARLLNDVYAEQIFRLGWLHADPHPGNLLVQAVPQSGPAESFREADPLSRSEEGRRGPWSGPRLVLLDHGLTVPLKPDMVAALAEMVTALLEGDFARLSRALGKAGVRLDEDLDVPTLLQLVGVVLGGEGRGSISTTAVGRQLAEGVGHIPTDLLLVGRALGLLDGITKQLDPDLNALAAIADYVSTADHAPTPGV